MQQKCIFFVIILVLGNVDALLQNIIKYVDIY